MAETKSENMTEIEVMARLIGVNIKCREMVDEWLLITYDIPCTPEGNAARNEFLHQARAIGATRHTDSVYLMPFTATAKQLALQLAKRGDVCVWSSKVDQAQAQQITKSYDDGLQPMFDEIDQRIDRIVENIKAKRLKRAEKMIDKTEVMVSDLKNAIVRRGSAQLYILFTLLERRFNAL
jgi:hypothetical protein